MKKHTKSSKNNLLILPNSPKSNEKANSDTDATVVNAQVYKEAKLYHEAIDKVYPGRYSFESVYENFLQDQDNQAF